MLDWLKEIIGDSYTEDIGKKVSEHIGKNFVSTANYNAANEAKKTLEGQIKDRDKQLDELKKVDAASLQAEISRLQEANTTAQSTYEKELTAVKLNNALDLALMGAKARDVKAVKPFINMELVKLDGDRVFGLDEQLKTIKSEKSFLFEGETKPPVKTGQRQNGSETSGGENSNQEVNAAFRAAFGRE